MTDVLTIAEWQAKHIVFCETCAQDTLPNERTGECFFCDGLISEPRTADPSKPFVETCKFPGCNVEFELHPRGKTREFCSASHRRRYWDAYSDAGRAYATTYAAQKLANNQRRRARLKAERDAA